MIKLDKKKYPVLSEDKVSLAVISKVAEGRPGNDFHDRFSGKFTYAPSGVQILKGSDFIKALSTPERAKLFKYAEMAKPNQLIARLVNGKLQVVLLRDGRKLATFPLQVEIPKEGKQAPENPSQGRTGAAVKVATGPIRDAIVDAARDLDLSGDALKKFIQQRAKGQLSPGDLASIENEVNAERLNMIVDYLHQRLRSIVKKESLKDKVRLAAGRGFLKKAFASMDKDATVEILTRLQARGWTENVVQDHVIDSLPKRLKDELNVKHKEATVEKN